MKSNLIHKLPTRRHPKVEMGVASCVRVSPWLRSWTYNYRFDIIPNPDTEYYMLVSYLLLDRHEEPFMLKHLMTDGEFFLPIRMIASGMMTFWWNDEDVYNIHKVPTVEQISEKFDRTTQRAYNHFYNLWNANNLLEKPRTKREKLVSNMNDFHGISS